MILMKLCRALKHAHDELEVIEMGEVISDHILALSIEDMGPISQIWS